MKFLLLVFFIFPIMAMSQGGMTITQSKQSFFDENKVKITAKEFYDRYNKYPFNLSVKEVNKDSIVFSLVKIEMNLVFSHTSDSLLKNFDIKDTTKYKVLIFWAKYCSPCIKKFPQVDSLYQKIKSSKNITLLSITNDAKKDVTKILSKYKPKFPILYNGKNYFKYFNVEILPLILVLDKFNNVKKVFREISYEDISEYL